MTSGNRIQWPFEHALREHRGGLADSRAGTPPRPTGVMPFSVLILDGESTYALNVARCLGAVPGVQIHVLSTRARATVRFSSTIESFHTWDGINGAHAVAECSALARKLGANLCLATDEAAIEFVARHGSDMSVPCTAVPSFASLRIALDKWDLARFLRAHALPHPATELLVRGREALTRIAQFGFPLLLKPRCGGNGLGIHRCENMQALEHCTRGSDLWEKTLVQTEIPGYDIDCSVLCRDGEVLAYTIQKGFTGTADFRPPGGIEFLEDDRVIAVMRKLMAALRWSGVAHVDLRYDSRTDRINIIEVNPRFWGSVLGSLHAGVNFPYLACLEALGRSFAPPAFRACRYVAGATALGYWRRGRFGRSSTGFSFTDTLFWYARRDLLPALIEPFQKNP